MASFDGFPGTVSARILATFNADMEHAALDMVSPVDGERFLVLGFGPGVGIIGLLDRVDAGSVSAVDPSGAMVAAAKRRLKRHRAADRVEIVKGTAPDLSPLRTFDAAVAVNNQQLWDPHADTVRAVGRLLRPGGRLVTLTHEWAVSRQNTVDAWKQMVEADLDAAGMHAVEWSRGTFRSGAGLGLVAHKDARR